MNSIRKIVSGGQTGADRAALDFAIQNGIEIGGYVPKGRMAENGIIPENYPNLIETESADPKERTELNIIHSDGTLILSQGDLTGGSQLAEKFALEHKKPFLHIDLLKYSPECAVEIALKLLDEIECRTLNIAGPRLSEDAEIYEAVTNFLRRLLANT